MDQPGRCRRTDGKRWRCSKAVVPNEKYCEKHMHRGCRRSRKLVESSIIAKPNLLNSVDPTCCPDLNISEVAWNETKSESIKDNIGFGAKDPKIEKSEDRRGNDRTTKITFKPEEKHDKKGSNRKVEEERLKKVTKRNTEGLEFCPKSVLGEGGVSFNQSNTQSVAEADESERRRCRRTDGKRWRCTKEVVAGDHKYCAKHMHRGSKKRLLVTPQQGECNSFALVKRANKLVVGFDSN